MGCCPTQSAVGSPWQWCGSGRRAGGCAGTFSHFVDDLVTPDCELRGFCDGDVRRAHYVALVISCNCRPRFGISDRFPSYQINRGIFFLFVVTTPVSEDILYRGLLVAWLR